MQYRDQMGRILEIEAPPKRIVSLVPSQTEFLYELGIKPIAQTVFCIHPKEEFKDANKIGGTKKLNIKAIQDLSPDLIIGNKEENLKEEIEILEQDHKVWMSDIYTLEDAWEMMLEIATILNKRTQAEAMVNQSKALFQPLKDVINKRSIYLIWRDPYMAVGKPSFIDHILEYLGIINLLEHERYPSLSLDEIRSFQPELLLLSSEPYPFKEKHREELQNELPNTKVMLVDGEMFSWYGSRLMRSPAYFQQLIKQIIVQ